MSTCGNVVVPLPPVKFVPVKIMDGTDAAPLAVEVIPVPVKVGPLAIATTVPVPVIVYSPTTPELLNSIAVLAPLVIVVVPTVIPPLPGGVAQVPSPLQKVEDEAEVPVFKLVTGILPDIWEAPKIVSVLELPLIVAPVIELGVIAPSVKVIAGVVVGLATEPDIPLAVTTDNVDTPPPPVVPPLSC